MINLKVQLTLNVESIIGSMLHLLFTRVDRTAIGKSTSAKYRPFSGFLRIFGLYVSLITYQLLPTNLSIVSYTHGIISA